MTAEAQHGPAAPTRAELVEEISTMLDRPSGALDPDANLVEEGLGSLDIIRLVNRWRRAGFEISFQELMREPSVAGWERYLRSLETG